MTSGVTELSAGDCQLLLASLDVGRIAVIDHGYPLVFPINYKEHWSVVRDVAEAGGDKFNKAAYEKETKREEDARAAAKK